jgi:pyridoxine/pyridoxamine 5'-phosphate oxidase
VVFKLSQLSAAMTMPTACSPTSRGSSRSRRVSVTEMVVNGLDGRFAWLSWGPDVSDHSGGMRPSSWGDYLIGPQVTELWRIRRSRCH